MRISVWSSDVCSSDLRKRTDKLEAAPGYQRRPGMKARPHALDDGRPSAVAITYDKSDSAPRVVAKGYGTLAENIIRTAKDNGLYVHESPELVGLLMEVDKIGRASCRERVCQYV